MPKEVLIATLSVSVVSMGAGAAFAQPLPNAPPAPTSDVSRSDAGARAAAIDQDTAAGSASAVGEVVVTSQSRAQTLQQTPAALTAFTDERRNLLGIETGRDIANLTPSTSLQGEYLSVRGVGRFENPGVGVDPGIAVHVDGVYTSSPSYLNQPDFLTDRIEVLRGPQSVFGRESIGGTVNVISKRPTADFHGDFRSGYTDREFGYVDAAVSGPISPTLRFRFGYAGSDSREGAQQNVGGDQDPGKGNSRLYEGQLDWDASPDLNIFFRYQNDSNTLSDSYGVQSGIGAGVGVANGYVTGTPAGYSAISFYGLALNPQFGLPADANPSLSDKRKVSLDDVGGIDINNDHTATINATYNLPFADLKYIGGWSQYNYYETSDADRTNRDFLTTPSGWLVASKYVSNSRQAKKWYSHELTLSSKNRQGLRWVVGLYDYSERYATTFDIRSPLDATLASPILAPKPGAALAAPNPTRAFYAQETRLRTDSQAVYGQLDYDLTPKVQITGSLRGNWDQRFGSDAFREVYGLVGFFGDFGEGPHALDVTPAAHDGAAHRDFSDWTGKVGAEYHPDRNLTAYVSIARGYKPGGFDLGNFDPVPTVAPETLTDYEAGVKKTWGRSLVIDAAVFYYDYTNLQVPLVVGSVSGAGGGTLFSSTLDNAQSTYSTGFELESVWSPRENLHFTLVYSYLRSRFSQFAAQTAGGVIRDPADGTLYGNLKGNTVPQAPENKLSLVTQYVAHVPTGDLSFVANFAYVGQQYYGIFNTPRYSAGAYENLDVRMVYQPAKSHWTALLYVRNVFDADQYIFYGPNTTLTAAGGLYTPQNLYTLAETRTIGGELQYRF